MLLTDVSSVAVGANAGGYKLSIADKKGKPIAAGSFSSKASQVHF